MSSPIPYRDFSIFKADRPSDGVLRLWLDTGLAGNGVTHENHPESPGYGEPSAKSPTSALSSSAASTACIARVAT
jgi:hypothetical protein